MHKVTLDWFDWQVSLAETHRHEHGREDAKFRWSLTLPWLGLAKNTGQTVRHSVADTILHNKLASVTKKIHCLVILHRNLLRMTFCSDCFPVYSWKAKPFSPNIATISGIQLTIQLMDSTSKYCKREAISWRSMLTQWTSGQNCHWQKLASVHQS